MLKEGIVLIFLNLGDLLLTGIGLKIGFFTDEKNFILSWYYGEFGFFGMAAFKIFIVASLLAAVELGWRKSIFTKDRGRQYYVAANIIFVFFFSFFTTLANFSSLF